MNPKSTIFVGLDVDSKNFHATLINRADGEIVSFRVPAKIADLVKKLRPFQKKGHELRICYEAGFHGFSIQRDLVRAGFHCDVIAPSNIPRSPGQRVKTDRIDAQKLAELYMNSLLTVVHVPDEVVESDRDLIRARGFLQKQVRSNKQYIVMYCRKLGLNYKEFTGSKQYFTGEHLKWLRDRVATLENSSQRSSLILLLKQYQQTIDLVADYDAELEKLAADDRYRKKVAALGCFRGISRVFALQLITEIGDVHRFRHPRQLTSYAGLDIIEYSSGGRERRYSITKTGNSQIRTAAVEACQSLNKTPRATKHLIARRKELGSTPAQIAVADRCMRRLYKKSTRLIMRSKHTNKVKVACAREMLGFVWEALKSA